VLPREAHRRLTLGLGQGRRSGRAQGGRIPEQEVGAPEVLRDDALEQHAARPREPVRQG